MRVWHARALALQFAARCPLHYRSAGACPPAMVRSKRKTPVAQRPWTFFETLDAWPFIIQKQSPSDPAHNGIHSSPPPPSIIIKWKTPPQKIHTARSPCRRRSPESQSDNKSRSVSSMSVPGVTDCCSFFCIDFSQQPITTHSPLFITSRSAKRQHARIMKKIAKYFNITISVVDAHLNVNLI